MDYASGIQNGMTVYGGDGKKLGRVIEKQAREFRVQQGWLRKKRYSCAYDEVADVRGHEVLLKIVKESPFLDREALKRRADAIPIPPSGEKPKGLREARVEDAESCVAQAQERADRAVQRARSKVDEEEEQLRRRILSRTKLRESQAFVPEELRAGAKKEEPARIGPPRDKH